ncbi:hypothetical protein I310_06460, partial [Cryptococcus deuterogattii CA1014]
MKGRRWAKPGLKCGREWEGYPSTKNGGSSNGIWIVQKNIDSDLKNMGEDEIELSASTNEGQRGIQGIP